MMGYNGVKFDQTGQNILAATYLIQLQGQGLRAGLAGQAPPTPSCEWPMKGWK